jgi:transcriptional regulator GlxA family with amidase domain
MTVSALWFVVQFKRLEALSPSISVVHPRSAVSLSTVRRLASEFDEHGKLRELIDVLFVVPQDALMLDIAGPAEAFRLANLHRRVLGLPQRFRLRYAGASSTVRTSVGVMMVELEELPTHLTGRTWVVVVGQAGDLAALPTPVNRATARWLRDTWPHGLDAASPHRLVTICSGTLLAARAGLLAGRRCTTHHELIDVLRAMAPEADVVENRVFVFDGSLATSAGVTAGIDLALHLISDECSSALAAAVAQDMVVYLRRSPSDPELSPMLLHRSHAHPAVNKVQDAICAAPDRDWDMPTLAATAHVTERHLLRLFVAHADVSPLRYLQTIRLELARQALARGENVARAADVAGFRSALQLRRAWQREWGGSPRDARISPGSSPGVQFGPQINAPAETSHEGHDLPHPRGQAHQTTTRALGAR